MATAPRAARLLVAVVAAGLVGAACVSADEATDGGRAELTVFAASSLTDAFSELGDAFMAAHPDETVTFNFASSSQLVVQINEGAPADVFAAADPRTMATLTKTGNAGNEPVTFATNSLEIVVGPGNPSGIGGIGDLVDPALIVVTCAPEVPCGTYASEVFDRAGVDVTPKSYEENVKAVVTKVALGEADAGIAYRTDVLAAADRVDGVSIPDDVNVVAAYPIVVTAAADPSEAAQTFVDFVLSAPGQQILATYGFDPP
jgi:molybdate transport system substrate-binding protein